MGCQHTAQLTENSSKGTYEVRKSHLALKKAILYVKKFEVLMCRYEDIVIKRNLRGTEVGN